jgi:hypothetical protein
VLLKATLSTRKETLQRLKEFYSLDRTVLIFRALRDLWDEDQTSQPLLALLCATARDPILYASSDIILSSPLGSVITRNTFSMKIGELFPDRYSFNSLRSIGENLASSWKKSGHLAGTAKKVRSKAQSCPTAVAYALFLGYLCNARGEGLFDTLWSRLLDSTTPVLHEQALNASQRGWLEYRRSGTITDITFRHLLRQSEPQQEMRAIAFD